MAHAPWRIGARFIFQKAPDVPIKNAPYFLAYMLKVAAGLRLLAPDIFHRDRHKTLRMRYLPLRK